MCRLFVLKIFGVYLLFKFDSESIESIICRGFRNDWNLLIDTNQTNKEIQTVECIIRYLHTIKQIVLFQFKPFVEQWTVRLQSSSWHNKFWTFRFYINDYHSICIATVGQGKQYKM